jgi:hypothetical protein
VAEYRLAAPRCACHTYFSVAEIGGWLHGNTVDTLAPVTEWAARADLWERAELGHDDLEARVAAAGGIICKHSLDATTLPDGRVRLDDGVHPLGHRPRARPRRGARGDEDRRRRVSVRVALTNRGKR